MSMLPTLCDMKKAQLSMKSQQNQSGIELNKTKTMDQ